MDNSAGNTYKRKEEKLYGVVKMTLYLTKTLAIKKIFLILRHRQEKRRRRICTGGVFLIQTIYRAHDRFPQTHAQIPRRFH